MSRSTRPLRRLRGADRATVVEALRARGGRLADPLARGDGGSGMQWLRRFAHAIAARPAQLRRCLLGRPVSARAAGRILGAVRT